MHICGVNYESVADGEGVRTTIFVSGCMHNCTGCHSPETHDFSYGTPVTDELISRINDEMCKRPFLSGVTLSGGDCMYSPTETTRLLKRLKIPKNNVWCYTGFTFEEIMESDNRRNLLKRIDVLVDGKYEQSQRDVSLQFRGSKNQRIIDVRKSLPSGKAVAYNF